MQSSHLHRDRVARPGQRVENAKIMRREISKDKNTFIVIVTRGHGHDADALKPCIGSSAAYVGMMGSRVKVAKLHEEFITKGWTTEEEWKRIHTPIGLKIGSQTIEEIAISIASELVMVRRIKS